MGTSETYLSLESQLQGDEADHSASLQVKPRPIEYFFNFILLSYYSFPSFPSLLSTTPPPFPPANPSPTASPYPVVQVNVLMALFNRKTGESKQNENDTTLSGKNTNKFALLEGWVKPIQPDCSGKE